MASLEHISGLGRNTHITVRDGNTVVTLYDTDIITLRTDGSIVLNSGGYHADAGNRRERRNRSARPQANATTRTRMNQVLREWDLPICIYQRKWDWYVTAKGVEYLFVDGMVITPWHGVKAVA